jgi:ribosomal protein L37AE/L43A
MYDNVKIYKDYQAKDYNFVYNILDIRQNEQKIIITYKYINNDDILQQIKNYFIENFDKLSDFVISFGTKYSKSINSVEILTDSCCICLEDYNDNKKILKCGHSVCSRCIKNIKKCPYCRQSIIKDSFTIKDNIKSIINQKLDKEKQEQELNKLFNYNEFIKNEITVKRLQLNDSLINVFGIIGKNIIDCDDGKILFRVDGGKLEQNEKQFKYVKDSFEKKISEFIAKKEFNKYRFYNNMLHDLLTNYIKY